jgi:hypothetical protein
MDDSLQKLLRQRHKLEAIGRSKTLLKCLQDPILSDDPTMISRLVKELEEHCRRAGLVERKPTS